MLGNPTSSIVSFLLQLPVHILNVVNCGYTLAKQNASAFFIHTLHVTISFWDLYHLAARHRGRNTPEATKLRHRFWFYWLYTVSLMSTMQPLVQITLVNNKNKVQANTHTVRHLLDRQNHDKFREFTGNSPMIHSSMSHDNCTTIALLL